MWRLVSEKVPSNFGAPCTEQEIRLLLSNPSLGLTYCRAITAGLYFAIAKLTCSGDGVRPQQQALHRMAAREEKSHMAVQEVEVRVTALEAEVTELRQKLEAVASPPGPWWQEIYGTFANDPLYEEAMRLGREYRESLGPKPVKRQTRRVTKRKK